MHVQEVARHLGSLDYAVAQLIEALRYKSEFFHWRNPSFRTIALRLTQPLTEMNTRNISWGWRRPVRGD